MSDLINKIRASKYEKYKGNNGTGWVRFNPYKTEEKHPSLTGFLTLNNEVMQLSMWLKTSAKTGEEYFGVTVKYPDKPVVSQPKQKDDDDETFGNF